MTDTRITAQSAAGTIYDLGYRHYEGKRRGRGYAFWSLFIESVRSIFGFGRPLRSKAAPFILIGLYSLGAVFQIGFLALAQTFGQEGREQFNQWRYDNYFASWGLFILLFCVAQAPELLARDQRYRILPLYFTRAITRLDYAIARLTSLTASLLIVLLVPMAALFGGRAFLSQDVVKGFEDQLPYVIPGLAACGLTAITLAAISLAVSAWSPRRAYCAISLIAYLLLVQGIPSIIHEIGLKTDWGWSTTILLVRPIAALEEATNWFFGVTPLAPFADFSQLPGTDQYVVAAVAMAVIGSAIVLLRYRRMPA